MQHSKTLLEPDHTTFDVAVVGARAAGAATALLLARQGLDVVLLDRGRYGSDTVSTHALMRAGVLQLSRWGLLDEVIRAGTPPVRQTVFRYGEQVVPVMIKPSHGVDALYAPRRTVLDPILVDAAREAGAEILHETAVSDVIRDLRGRVVGVRGSDRNRNPVDIRARIVVGADGSRSRIARAVDAPVQRAGTGATTIAYSYWSELDDIGYEWNFSAGAASGAIPTNDNQTCVFVATRGRQKERVSVARMPQLVAETSVDLAGRLASARPASTLRTYPGQPGYVRRSWGDGWALVGDAGYYKDPLSSHGLTDALRDAELLARAIVSIVDYGVDMQEALRGYQESRDLLSMALFDVVDRIARLGWTDEEIGGLLLQLSASMADELEAVHGFSAEAGATLAG